MNILFYKSQMLKIENIIKCSGGKLKKSGQFSYPFSYLFSF